MQVISQENGSIKHHGGALQAWSRSCAGRQLQASGVEQPPLRSGRILPLVRSFCATNAFNAYLNLYNPVPTSVAAAPNALEGCTECLAAMCRQAWQVPVFFALSLKNDYTAVQVLCLDHLEWPSSPFDLVVREKS